MANPTTEEQIEASFKAQQAALMSRDTEALGALLTAGFTRTHLNNQTISKDEWLHQVASRKITYHGFEYDSIRISVDGTTATLVARLITDATMYGERKLWRQQLRQSFLRSGGKWLCSRSVGSPW